MKQKTRYLLHAATVEHIRFWWGDDGIDFGRIKARRKVGTDDVRRIFTRYRVGRGLLKSNDTGLDIGANGVSGLLNKEIRFWPATMKQRCNFIVRLSEEALQKGYSKGRLISGFSKIVWFMRPTGWTLYDSYAADALQIPKQLGAVDKVSRFYACLEDLGFVEACDRMRITVNDSNFPTLWPERIVDKALWIRGSNERQRAELDKNHQFYLNAIGPKNRLALGELIETLTPIASSYVFFETRE